MCVSSDYMGSKGETPWTSFWNVDWEGAEFDALTALASSCLTTFFSFSLLKWAGSETALWVWKKEISIQNTIF